MNLYLHKPTNAVIQAESKSHAVALLQRELDGTGEQWLITKESLVAVRDEPVVVCLGE